MPRSIARLLWGLVSAAAAIAMGAVAANQGEPVNSTWLVVAAVCTYLVGYRFYAGWVAAKVMALDNSRATPAERLRKLNR